MIDNRIFELCSFFHDCILGTSFQLSGKCSKQASFSLGVWNGERHAVSLRAVGRVSDMSGISAMLPWRQERKERGWPASRGEMERGGAELAKLWSKCLCSVYGHPWGQKGMRGTPIFPSVLTTPHTHIPSSTEPSSGGSFLDPRKIIPSLQTFCLSRAEGNFKETAKIGFRKLRRNYPKRPPSRVLFESRSLKRPHKSCYQHVTLDRCSKSCEHFYPEERIEQEDVHGIASRSKCTLALWQGFSVFNARVVARDTRTSIQVKVSMNCLTEDFDSRYESSAEIRKRVCLARENVFLVVGLMILVLRAIAQQQTQRELRSS